VCVCVCERERERVRERERERRNQTEKANKKIVWKRKNGKEMRKYVYED
jgi:hypothetical protein